MRNRDTAPVYDATVGKGVILAELTFALDDVRRAVRIVDNLPVEFLNVAARWTGAGARPLLFLLLLLLPLRLHRHSSGGSGCSGIRDWRRRWYGIAGAGFRARGWTGRPGVMGLVQRSPCCRGGPAPSTPLLLRAHLLLLLRVRGILKGPAVLLLSLLLLLVLVEVVLLMLLMMGRHQLLVELMLPDRARRVLLEVRGRNVVMLKVVLGGMRLTGGHHPKREAGASLTSPTAPAPTLSRLTLLLLLLLPNAAHPAPFNRCLSVVISSPPPTDALLATPTQPQVVPVTSNRHSPFKTLLNLPHYEISK